MTAVAVAAAAVLGPACSAAERLAHAQQRADELQALLDQKFEQLGEAGIVRPKDTLLFVENLEHKDGKGTQITCSCMFCRTRVISTGATRVIDHFLSCPLCPQSVKAPVQALRDSTKKKRKVKEEHFKHVKALSLNL